jgi:hypothetical protein
MFLPSPVKYEKSISETIVGSVSENYSHKSQTNRRAVSTLVPFCEIKTSPAASLCPSWDKKWEMVRSETAGAHFHKKIAFPSALSPQVGVLPRK